MMDNMQTRQELILSLSKLFEADTPTSADDMTLVQTDPEYDAFVSLLKYHNTKDFNVAVNKLNANVKKIFIDWDAQKRAKFLSEVRDMHLRLVASNARNKIIVEYMIVDWVNNALKD